jgi:hypothetical protein
MADVVTLASAEGTGLSKKLSTVLVETTISIRVGFGAIKLPSSDLKGSEYLSKVYAANGVKSNDSIQIYEAQGIDPESGKVVTLSPAWAKNKLTASAQEIQEAYSIGGKLYSQEDFPKVNQQIEQMIERSERLLETLLLPVNWNAAEATYQEKVSNIFAALAQESALERDRLITADPLCADEAHRAHEERLEGYDRKRCRMLNKFPTPEEFRKKFKVSNSEPIVRGSVIGAVSQSADAVKHLAEIETAQGDLAFARAVSEARNRALEDFKQATQERIETLHDEFSEHILNALKSLDGLGAKEISNKAKNALDFQLTRCEAILNLLAGLSQFEPDLTKPQTDSQTAIEAMAGIQDLTSKLRQGFEDSSNSREQCQAQLQAFRRSLAQTINVIHQGEGTQALAEWCLLDQGEAPIVASAAPAQEVLIDTQTSNPTPAATPSSAVELLI